MVFSPRGHGCISKETQLRVLSCSGMTWLNVGIGAQNVAVAVASEDRSLLLLIAVDK